MLLATRAARPCGDESLEHGERAYTGRRQVPRVKAGPDQEPHGRRQQDQSAGRADQLLQKTMTARTSRDATARTAR